MTQKNRYIFLSSKIVQPKNLKLGGNISPIEWYLDVIMLLSLCPEGVEMSSPCIFYLPFLHIIFLRQKYLVDSLFLY